MSDSIPPLPGALAAAVAEGRAQCVWNVPSRMWLCWEKGDAAPAPRSRQPEEEESRA